MRGANARGAALSLTDDELAFLLRVIVKRILRKYGYRPDKQEKATQTVLEQAEVLSSLWAA